MTNTSTGSLRFSSFRPSWSRTEWLFMSPEGLFKSRQRIVLQRGKREPNVVSRSDMTLEPLIHAPLAVQAHVGTVLPAFALGAWLLVFSRKGSRWHRALGALFLGLMASTAIIAVFIHRQTPDSPLLGMSPTHLF